MLRKGKKTLLIRLAVKAEGSEGEMLTSQMHSLILERKGKKTLLIRLAVKAEGSEG